MIIYSMYISKTVQQISIIYEESNASIKSKWNDICTCTLNINIYRERYANQRIKENIKLHNKEAEKRKYYLDH